MLCRSLRFGMALFILLGAILLNQFNKVVEQTGTIVGARARFGVTLEAEGRTIGAMYALQGAVEQGDVSGTQALRQAVLVHRKPVVLGGDHDGVVVQAFHRVVGTVMAELHLDGLGTGGQTQQLVTQADAEHRGVGPKEGLDGLDGVVARLGVTGAVGEEDAIRVQRQHLGGRGLGRHYCQAAAAVHQHAQDIALDAKVVGHHVVFQLIGGRGDVPLAELPATLGPAVGFADGHFLGQIHPLQTGEGAGLAQGMGFIELLAGQDATGLGTLLAQDAGQFAGVDVGDANDVVRLEVIGEGLLIAEIGGKYRKVPDDQSLRVDLTGLFIFAVGAGVAYMGVSEGDYLTGIRGIGEDFLIARHRRIENHFTNGTSLGAYRHAFEHSSIFQH
ncbi:hypothetical protein D3C81_701360 [compost metagenome]